MGSYRSTIMVVAPVLWDSFAHKNPTGPAYFAPQTSTTTLVLLATKRCQVCFNGGSYDQSLSDLRVRFPTRILFEREEPKECPQCACTWPTTTSCFARAWRPSSPLAKI